MPSASPPLRTKPAGAVSKTLHARVVQALFGDSESPYATSPTGEAESDFSYPHTHLPQALVSALLRSLTAPADRGAPLLIVELGSFVGGSAARLAGAARDAALSDFCILCVDPFVGDANMWCDVNGWRSWLRLRAGRPSLYETFLANMRVANLNEVVLPLCATATVGMAVLRRLTMAGGETGCCGAALAPALPRPRLIYLDSAHEEGEVFVEVSRAFELLAPGGLLLGDDWGWPAVQADVLRFAREKAPSLCTTLPPLTGVGANALTPVRGVPGLAVTDGGVGASAQWLLRKPRGGDPSEWAEASASMVRLAQAMAVGATDIPELGVWAAQASRAAENRGA